MYQIVKYRGIELYRITWNLLACKNTHRNDAVITTGTVQLFLLLLLLLFYFYKLFCSGTVLRKWQFILTSYPAIESNSQFYEDIIWHTQKKDVIPQESVIHIGISRCCYVWQVLMSYLVLKWSYQAYMLFLGLNYIAFFWIGPKADRISTTRT